MSEKRKEKRAKERDKLKTARRAAAQSPPRPQQYAEAKKQPTVPAKHSQREAVDKVTDMEIPPSVPSFDQLEQIAAREKPEAIGAWWIALQAAHHVIECATERDMHTGESLPRPFIEVLKAIAHATKTGTRPIPNDHLHRAAVLAFESLRTILNHPRTRLLREHAQRPIHSIREMDTHCMAWLARLPGRTIREKLAGKQHALSVIRQFTPDTPENRVAKRVVDLLARQLGERFAHSDAYDEDGPCYTQQLDTLNFCRRILRDEEFGLIPPSDRPQPNNALLSDRLYSRIWRAWMLLHGGEDALRATWPHAEEYFRTSAFWTIAGQIAERYDARVVEEQVVPNVETDYKGLPTKIELLVMPGSGTEASVISIQQVQEGIRIEENRLRTQSGSAKGRVKLIRDDSDRRFGFISGESGEEYYFDPKTVGNKDTFSSLCEGDSVTFSVGKRSKHKRLAPALNVRQYETGLRVAHVIEKGSKTWCVGFNYDGSGQSDFQSFRGFPIYLTRENDRRTTSKRLTALSDLKYIVNTDWQEWADIEGLRSIAKNTIPSLNLKLPPTSDTSLEGTTSAIGIDPFSRCVFVGTKEKAWSTVTLPYALHQESQWQIGTCRRLPSIGTPWTLHPLNTNLSTCDAAEESTAIASYHQIVRALTEEVQAQEVSFVIPDGLDEFSQQTLRAAMLGAFPRSRPVARSVAAALAWQQQKEFSKQGVKNGDVVLVLGAETDMLTFSLLVARYDRRLEEELPKSGGIFWERRPALPTDEYGEGLGLRHIWRDYARRLFKVNDRDESYQDEIISYIVDSGLLQEAVESNSPRWIRDQNRWLVLEHSPQHWAEVLWHWRRRFDKALKSDLRQLIARAVTKQNRCHLLLIGPPFNETSVRYQVKNAIEKAIRLPFKHVDYIASEKGELAVGAAEFTERSCAGLPAWRDWLPDLFLEIIQNGLYNEVELMRDTVVDTTLGTIQKKDVAEELVLPAGQDHYLLPLVSGRANRQPVSADLRLDSDSFPLQNDLRVRLELSYQYGVENGYEITVIPVETETAPFGALKGKWVRSNRTVDGPKTNLVPTFPRRVLYEIDPESATAIAEIKQETERLLSGEANNPAGTINWVNSQLRRQRMKLEQAALRTLEDSNYGVESESKEDSEWSLKHILHSIPRRSRNRVLPLTYDHSDFLEAASSIDVVEILLKVVDNRQSLLGSSHDAENLEAEAFLFLCALGKQVPETIATNIRTKLNSDEPHLVPGYYANAMGVLHRTDPNEHWLDFLWKKIVERIEPYDNPRLYGESIYEVAHTVWVLPGFLEDFAERNSRFVQTSLLAIERGVRNVVSKAAQAIDPNSEITISRGYVRRFQSCCELVLALVRLRDTQLGAPLSFGSPRMSQLAKSIRRADCLLTQAGMEVRTSLDFELDKPNQLAQVSDLAYATNYYLLGHETMNLASRRQTG